MRCKWKSAERICNQKSCHICRIHIGRQYVSIFKPFLKQHAFQRKKQEHKYIRYNVIRGSLKSYVLSKTTVIYISSLSIMILGSVLFLFLCRTYVPWTDWSIDSYGIELNGCYGSILEEGHVILYCTLYALNLGLIAGALSNMAALCSVFISNTVLVLVFPVLANIFVYA